ncbi:uncharacterized protein [Panulirus ornatus]|uniref:uncharacterized protein isoform X2 n=1 Tax=Panulirus ornatus TaxID=150431 RepID=UPI003A861ABB
MSSHRAATHSHWKSSRGSANVPPSRSRIKDAKTSNMDKELDSIQSRRARLQALTTSIKLPPLTPIDVLGTRSSPLISHTSPKSIPARDRQLRRRQRADLSSSSKASTASGRVRSRATKLPALSRSSAVPGRPYRNPLPEIGHVREKLEKEEEEMHLEKANVESPPPPTYEETLKVSQWVEEISQESLVETSPSLESQENGEPTPTTVEAPPPAVEPSEAPLIESDEATEEEKIDFVKIVSDMGSEDLQIQLQATLKARQLLSQGSISYIDDFLGADILTPALANLQKEDVTLLFETAWIITNIASGDTVQTLALADRGIIEAMVQLLYMNDAKVQEQVVWALGNMAGDGLALRNRVVAAGVVKPLMALITKDSPTSLLNHLSWMLCNIFRSKDLEMAEEEKLLVLQAMKEHLLTRQDLVMLVDAIWALSYYIDMGDVYIQQVVDAGILPMLVQHLQSHDQKVQKAAVRALGNIITGSDAQTDVALDAGVLPIFHQLLVDSDNDIIKREAAWSLSNILAGTPVQIQKVIDEGIIPALVESVQKAEFSVRKEATWALTNMTYGGTEAQIKFLVSAGGLQQLVSTMNTADTRLALLGVEAIGNILKNSDDVNEIKVLIEEYGGLDTLEAYQTHKDTCVADKAIEILHTYFSDSVDLCTPSPQDEDTAKDCVENQHEELALAGEASEHMGNLAVE